MTCFSPLQAIDIGINPESGKRNLKILKRSASCTVNQSLLVPLPCGQCTGCRLERSRQWAVRCEKEIQLVESRGGSNCFITLTFDDESLAKREFPMSLDKRDFQLFMKRLRKRFGEGVRYYHCGEYGELFKRPHYHAILFNCDFPDKKLYKVCNGQRLFTSQVLSEIWPFGFSSVGSATFESAAYVARYIMKKHLGQDAWLRYIDYIDHDTGEIVGHRIPEYTTMSRRSGIGKEWFDKYYRDVYPTDGVFIRGKMMKCKPPRYYDGLYEHHSPSDFASLKLSRVEQALKHSDDNTRERLEVREKVVLSRIKSLKRNLE